jgi:hypothetical protein
MIGLHELVQRHVTLGETLSRLMSEQQVEQTQEKLHKEINDAVIHATSDNG